jgi:bleomycin hydrolase
LKSRFNRPTRLLFLCFSFLCSIHYSLVAQAPLSNKTNGGYQFTIEQELATTEVKNQNRTSTCWSFSALSFLESELLKAGKPKVDLSEMFVVRNIYFEKAVRYVRMHGANSLAPGGAFHDVTFVMDKYGLVPENIYPGNPFAGNKHDHQEIDGVMKAFCDALIKNENGPLNPNWQKALNGLLDGYFGVYPAEFQYEGKKYTPKSFAAMLGLKGEDFIEISSFTHHPLYSRFVLEVPDNWAWGQVYNVSIDEMVQVLDNSLKNNYSVAWASDVSEKGFSFKQGVAVVPQADLSTLNSQDLEKLLNEPCDEKVITAEIRQEAFDNYLTQDDHGMHIVGAAKDQKGKRFYLVKNSWGADRNDCKGYFYCSVPYFQYKTTCIMVHKNAVPKPLAKKLGI